MLKKMVTLGHYIRSDQFGPIVILMFGCVCVVLYISSNTKAPHWIVPVRGLLVYHVWLRGIFLESAVALRAEKFVVETSRFYIRFMQCVNDLIKIIALFYAIVLYGLINKFVYIDYRFIALDTFPDCVQCFGHGDNILFPIGKIVFPCERRCYAFDQFVRRSGQK